MLRTRESRGRRSGSSAVSQMIGEWSKEATRMRQRIDLKIERGYISQIVIDGRCSCLAVPIVR